MPFNKTTEIPSGAFNFPTANRLFIEFEYNRINALSSDLFYSPTATKVALSFNDNRITSISSGSFKFPNTKQFEIFLSNNQITSINAAGAFEIPIATKILIDLHNNNLKTIPGGTFKFSSAKALKYSLAKNPSIPRFRKMLFDIRYFFDRRSVKQRPNRGGYFVMILHGLFFG